MIRKTKKKLQERAHFTRPASEEPMNETALTGEGRGELAAASAIYLIVNIATSIVFWSSSAGGHLAGFTDFPLDDAWIHLVYARSVATHLLPEYNPGQLEAGMTSPLWVILNGIFYWPGHWLHLNPTIMPKMLSLVFGVLSTMLLHVLIRRREGSLAMAVAACLLLSLDSQWCFSRSAGMEVPLFAFLALASLAALESRRNLLSGIAAGLAAVVRPEGILLTALILPVGILRSTKEDRRYTFFFLKTTLPALLIFGSWAGYNLLVTGHPLPNTFYVKAQTASFLRADNLWVIIKDLLLGCDFFKSYIGMALYIGGSIALLKKNFTRNAPVLVFPWIFIYGLSVTHSFLQPSSYYWSRYFHPMFPFLVFPVFFGSAWMDDFLKRRKIFRSGISQKHLSVAALLLVWIALAAPAVMALPKKATLFSMNCMNIRKGNVETGKWLAANTRPDDWIATMDAGAIRYFSDRSVLDIAGLNNHVLAHALKKKDSIKIFLKALDEIKPDYFVLFPRQYRSIIRVFDLQPVHSVDNTPYTICDCPYQSTITVFRAGWTAL